MQLGDVAVNANVGKACGDVVSMFGRGCRTVTTLVLKHWG